MNFNDYQERARKTAIYPDLGNNLNYVALGLCGEAGELANKVKKIMRDNDGQLTEEMRKDIYSELGDILWYLSNTCDELDVDLEGVASFNLHKLESRKERGKLKGSGGDR